MELLLLKLAAFLRPIFFVEIGNENLFDLAAILLFVLLVGALLSNAALRKSIDFSPLDVLIVAFSMWCIAVYIVYIDKAHARDVAKLVIPLFGFIVAKNILRNEAQYLKMLQWMIFGFAFPVMLSAALILTGGGIETIGKYEVVNYWTGIARYQGAYSGSHNFGHNMTFFVMLMVLYITLSRTNDKARSDNHPLMRNATFIVLGAAAAYCLFMSQVRTAVAGLLLFGVMYLYFFNKRILIIGAGAMTLVVLAMLPTIVRFLFPDIVMVQQGEGDISDLGSGRPNIWAGNLELFGELPLDRQIAGVGIGNKGVTSPEGIWDSHNDYLDIMMQTGVVGFVLFMSIQALFLRRILRLPSAERHVFLTLFAAVSAMNFLSNSYVSRFGLAQMLYFLLAYVEVSSRKAVSEEEEQALPTARNHGEESTEKRAGPRGIAQGVRRF